jgi:uncharacterized protein (DUF4415 family)
MRSHEIVRSVLVDGKLYERRGDGTLSPLADETNYARLDVLSPTEVESVAENDADDAPMSD